MLKSFDSGLSNASLVFDICGDGSGKVFCGVCGLGKETNKEVKYLEDFVQDWGKLVPEIDQDMIWLWWGRRWRWMGFIHGVIQVEE